MKNTVLYIMLATLLVSCAKFDNPQAYTPVQMTANTTIKNLKAMYNNAATEITEDIIISGVVNSSDREGNIYRSLYIQDNTAGIEVKIGKTGLYNTYKEGMTLYVKAKDLYLGQYGGVVQLGAKSTDTKYETAYIDVQYLIDEHILRGEVGEKVTPIVISEQKQLKDTLIGRLVTIKEAIYTGGDNVTILGESQALTTWAVSASLNNRSALSGNQNFKLGSQKIVVRSSGYSKFADSPAPNVGAKVDLTGILTKYYSTYQLVLVSINGVVIK